GNFFGWVARYHRFMGPLSYIGPTSGAMGYGLPAALGAKWAQPQQPVVLFAGDGGFMMTLQELATAYQYALPVLCIVVNNHFYGTIHAHQEKYFPGRTVGTKLQNPDFAALAQSFGLFGERVTCNDDFLPALQRAWESGRSAVVEVIVHPQRLTVNQPHPMG
ncbi:MAG: thiamine pyrophosphate-dependent enzyme, partial [Firmicutes bacterium]|nr:thiamine pyrophosphate-dependent enzyme [Bacillota bacterium]